MNVLTPTTFVCGFNRSHFIKTQVGAKRAIPSILISSYKSQYFFYSYHHQRLTRVKSKDESGRQKVIITVICSSLSSLDAKKGYKRRVVNWKSLWFKWAALSSKLHSEWPAFLFEACVVDSIESLTR